MRRALTTLLLAATLTMSGSCSSFYGAGENTAGSESISSAPSSLDFEGTVGETSYRTLTFANRSSENYEITNLAFVDNGCGDFSVYNILDSSGNVLYMFGDTVAVSVVAGASISINLKFSPNVCEISEYVATLIIYYTTDSGEASKTVELHAVTDQTAAGSDADCADPVEREYNDELGDPTVSRTSAPAGDYYIRVDRIRSYIQPTAGFASYAIQVGTDLALDQIADEDEFQPIYLPLYYNGAAGFRLFDVTSCSGFKLPTPITDDNLRGATAVLSITGPDTDENDQGYTAGTLVTTYDEATDATDERGRIDFPGVDAYMFAAINNTQSLIQNDDGEFGITVEMDLTTGKSEPNSYLESVFDLTDDDGAAFLNINLDGENSTLQGSNMRHGVVRLVGIGIFTAPDFVGSQIAEQALIENQAFIFIQIDGYITYEKTE